MKVGQHFSMPQSTPPEFGINSWLEDELYQQYLHDRKTVDDSWKQVFESNGGTPPTEHLRLRRLSP
jgi:2-oxoglutarate decarboxylase